MLFSVLPGTAYAEAFDLNGAYIGQPFKAFRLWPLKPGDCGPGDRSSPQFDFPHTYCEKQGNTGLAMDGHDVNKISAIFRPPREDSNASLYVLFFRMSKEAFFPAVNALRSRYGDKHVVACENEDSEAPPYSCWQWIHSGTVLQLSIARDFGTGVTAEGKGAKETHYTWIQLYSEERQNELNWEAWTNR
ncbi:MAG: hypothetical protein IPH26_09195 [Sterolibacteriaceae bacterium]|uniref:Uncharacterized protein n=1 Tax=Candidatus Methylophosphatis roskildensis TaxID=2899263 RepID=A0A9D7E3E7_9PROT|nr:hypothetical protein [Candidatus Methylophosphatis roskildensis]